MQKTNGITILGLGPGDPKLLTRQAWDLLENATEIYLRTNQHPSVTGLPKSLRVHSFDEIYEETEEFENVYSRIVEKVLELGKRPEGMIYAVPGHPFVGEATSPEITRRAKELGIPINIVEGLSFIEPVCSALNTDPLPHTSVVDALELALAHHPPFPPDAPALIAQIYSPTVAAEVKIALMSVYPDEFSVKLVHAAGTHEVLVETLPLHAIDHSEHIGLHTSLYLPALAENSSFEAFQELIAHLRAPEGCPWDREQTHQSLRPNLLEETYETLAAIDANNPQAMVEEFGDLLLQIVLHSQIASEYGEFKMKDILAGIHTKLVNRHPHVFEDVDLDDAQSVIQNWERLKAHERQVKGDEQKGLLDGIPPALPALGLAELYQKRAARVGFDWPNIEGVLNKIEEEIGEVRQAAQTDERASEIGDLIFALVNLARWQGIDAESALRETNIKFRKRFANIEKGAKDQGKQLSDMSLEEMEALWEQAKGV
ncbi:MAG: nucleoside triphosphate pyrophosphohydrolase [Chloroflexi bacterium]|nr:nucleoside triphosphate pyrophosphohydrolase [Chloroflexota bacterium]